MPEHDPLRRHPQLPAQKVEYVQYARTQFVVDGDRRARRVMGLGRGPHRPHRVHVEGVEAARDLDEPGTHTAVADPLCEFPHEHVGEDGAQPVEQLRCVVGGLMKSRRGHDAHTRRGRQLGQQLGPAPQTVRRPLDDRAAARLPVGAQFRLGGCRVVELLAGEQRAAEEEVVVRVAHTEFLRRHVPEHGPYGRGHQCLPRGSRWRSGALRCSTS